MTLFRLGNWAARARRAAAARRENASGFRVTGCRKDERGVAAVEFALVITPFLIMVFMIIEFSRGDSSAFIVDRATVETAREMTEARNTINSMARFEEEFCRNAAGLPGGCDVDNLFVYIVADGDLRDAMDAVTRTTCALYQPPTPPDDPDCSKLIVDEQNGASFLGRECEGRDPPYSGVCPKCDQPPPDPYIETAFADPGPNEFAFYRVCYEVTEESLATPLRRLLHSGTGGGGGATTRTIQASTAVWSNLLRCRDGTHGNGTCK